MSGELGTSLLSMVVAISISMALIPLLIRFAPALGMMDEPDPRKVHKAPVPRVGGVGIVVGALVSLAIWLPWDDVMVSYLLGSLTLLVFGVWDDVKELGHYVKFIGQFIAVILVVYHGDLYVTHLPFMGGEPMDETVGKLFTVFAMVGMINAINHSDGLDGLAGGESLLSLCAIGYMAYKVDDLLVVLITSAALGGVFGFLRYNSHPARVFMGDGGSQYLGFTLGFLAVYLKQVSNPALSPVVPLLLLGLPVIDILAVFVQRVHGKMNWFKATRNHIHHRLLELGFRHHESVVVIYSIQAIMVIIGVLLPYESDALLVALYLLITISLFSFLVIAESKGWRARAGKGRFSGIVKGIQPKDRLRAVDHRFIQIVLAVFLVSGALLASRVPNDLAYAAGFLFVILSLRLVFGYRLWFLFLRLLIFVTVAFIAYLFNYYPSELLDAHMNWFFIFYGVMAVAVMLSVRSSNNGFFEATPLDYLVVILVLVFVGMSETGYADPSSVTMVVQLIVLFYAAEVVIKNMKSRVNVLTISSLGALGILAARGFS